MTPPSTTCPGCGRYLPMDTVICINCGFNRRTGRRVDTGSGDLGLFDPVESRRRQVIESAAANSDGYDSGQALKFIGVIVLAVGGMFGGLYLSFRGSGSGATTGGDGTTTEGMPYVYDSTTPPMGNKLAPEPFLLPRPSDADDNGDRGNQGKPPEVNFELVQSELQKKGPLGQQQAAELSALRSHWLEAYQRVGRRNASWNEHAERALAWAAFWRVGASVPVNPPVDPLDAAWAASYRALAAGCNDDLIAWLHLRLCSEYLWMSPQYRGAKSQEIAERFADNPYPAGVICEVVAHSAWDWCSTNPHDPNQLQKYLDLVLAKLGDALRESPNAPRDLIAILEPTLRATRTREPSLDKAVDKLAQQLRQADRSAVHWLALLETLARVDECRRLQARLASLGGQDQPTIEAARQEFQAGLAQAAAAGESAWTATQAKNDRLAAAAVARLMLERQRLAAVVSEQFAQEIPPEELERTDLWFDRAVANEPSHPGPWSAKLAVLQTLRKSDPLAKRGTEFAATAVTAFQSHRAPVAVLRLVQQAHWEAARRLPTGLAEAQPRPGYLADSANWQQIAAASLMYQSHRNFDRLQTCEYLVVACWAEQWPTVREQFARLGDRPARLSPFGGDPNAVSQLREQSRRGRR